MTESDPVREDLLKITQYELLQKLPDPFLCENGARLTDPAGWRARRAEIAKTAIDLQYGTQPPAPEFLEVERLYGKKGLSGYHIRTGTKRHPVQFRMQVLLPDDAEKCPVILTGDQCWKYSMDREYLNAALGAGVGWVFFDRTELAHDISDEGRRQGQLYGAYPGYGFGALGAWAWGYSRCVGALEKPDLPIDRDWIAFCGHARGAKTAALAGALDERAKIVNPNATCAGACGCYRIHMKGIYENEIEKRSETLDDLMRRFSFWMGEGMEEYREREADLPFDTHFLKAMIAPRILYVSEGAGDLWSNPVGSWQTSQAAKEVFKFLGVEKNLVWSFRPGFHKHSVADVEMLVDLIRHFRDGAPLSDKFFRLPFRAPEPAFDWRCPCRAARDSDINS